MYKYAVYEWISPDECLFVVDFDGDPTEQEVIRRMVNEGLLSGIRKYVVDQGPNEIHIIDVDSEETHVPVLVLEEVR